MLKNLAMLLKLRAWLRSGGLQAGGLVTVLGGLQTWLGTDTGMDVIGMVAMYLHLMTATVMGLIMSAIGIVMLLSRAKAEWSLTEKVAGVDKVPQNPGGSGG